MTVLPITIATAGAAALVNLWIATRVCQARRRFGIPIGDGGNEAVLKRMRAHSNFVEYAPFFLILLALIELAEGSKQWLWAASVAFILGRMLHVFGMDRPFPNRFRMVGNALSMLTLLGLALYALAIPYLHRPAAPSITYAAASHPLAANIRSATKGL